MSYNFFRKITFLSTASHGWGAIVFLSHKPSRKAQRPLLFGEKKKFWLGIYVLRREVRNRKKYEWCQWKVTWHLDRLQKKCQSWQVKNALKNTLRWIWTCGQERRRCRVHFRPLGALDIIFHHLSVWLVTSRKKARIIQILDNLM